MMSGSILPAQTAATKARSPLSDSAAPPQTAFGRAYPVEASKSPRVIILLLILVIMVPIEFSLQIGPLFLPPARIFLIILTFMILPHVANLKLRAFDWMFIGHVAWVCVANVLIYGVGPSVQMSGSYVLEFLTVYLAARIYLQTVEDIRAVILLIVMLVLLSGALALPEALTGVRFIHDLGRSITGIVYKFDPEMRMGITRAASFFEHPILYGTFCASSFSLMWFVTSPGQRIVLAPLIMFATWLSASSAPLLTLMVQIVLLVVERLTRHIRRRDKLLGWVAGIFALVMQVFTGRGVVGLVMLMTINPGTAYTRRAQWNFAIDDVMRNPWFGFVPSTYTRPFWLAPSIDNWWLLIMMRSGIPSLILLALSALFLWIAIARRDGPPLFKNLRTGWGMMMIALVLGAATVTFFGKLQPLFAFYMGMGAALATCALPVEGETRPASPVGRGGVRYTRFPRTGARAATPRQRG
jgi:hypothetical protein